MAAITRRGACALVFCCSLSVLALGPVQSAAAYSWRSGSRDGARLSRDDNAQIDDNQQSGRGLRAPIRKALLDEVLESTAKHAGRELTQDAGVAGTENPAKRKVCLNTCSKAKNGVCEDGRRRDQASNPTRMVYCDLGTDCDDCGPWETTAEKLPWEEASSPGPIALLMSKDVQVRVREANVPPQYSFGFAYTDPQKDFDVSRHMDSGALVEGGISLIFYKIFDGVCVGPDGKRKLFVDVGANFGWYAILAARMGCRVIGFEPVPHFHAFFVYSTYLNDLQDLITIHKDVVSYVHGEMVKFVVPSRGIWGTAGIDGANIDKAIPSDHEELQLKAVALDEVIKEDVLLIKVDVEGFEWSVFKGAEKMMKAYKVDNIIMEYSPGVPERAFNFNYMAATPAMLVELIRGGFRISHIYDGKHMESSGWLGPLPVFPEVTLANLKYDVHDVQLWKQNKLGCPPTPELAQFAMWRGCGGVPEDINPRSLRAEIGHNTNVWASKNTSLMVMDGVVGIIKPNEPATQFYNTKPEGKLGQGGRPCAHLPVQVQVRHRCRCSVHQSCGEEERALEAAAREGKVANSYVLPDDYLDKALPLFGAAAVQQAAAR